MFTIRCPKKSQYIITFFILKTVNNLIKYIIPKISNNYYHYYYNITVKIIINYNNIDDAK